MFPRLCSEAATNEQLGAQAVMMAHISKIDFLLRPDLCSSKHFYVLVFANFHTFTSLFLYTCNLHWGKEEVYGTFSHARSRSMARESPQEAPYHQWSSPGGKDVAHQRVRKAPLRERRLREHGQQRGHARAVRHRVRHRRSHRRPPAANRRHHRARLDPHRVRRSPGKPQGAHGPQVLR